MAIPQATLAEAKEFFKQFEFPYLRELQAILADEIKYREKDALRDAKEQIRKIAADYGMTPEAIMALKLPKPAAAPVVRGGPGVYRSPNNPSLEWKGMGPRPQWLKELLAEGHTFDSLRVAA